VTENHNWIEVFFDGDLMHTRTVNLPVGDLFNIYVEEIPHKTTVYEHPRAMIFSPGRPICASPATAIESSSQGSHAKVWYEAPPVAGFD
jgi:hypothetical protein